MSSNSEKNLVPDPELCDESITLGVQFKDRKFMLKVDNILKGNNTQQDLLYGIILRMKEKLSVAECSNQQGTVKKTEMLKLQEATHRFEESERDERKA